MTALMISSLSVFALETAPATNTAYEEKVVELVNIERQKYGLPLLYIDKAISDVAN